MASPLPLGSLTEECPESLASLCGTPMEPETFLPLAIAISAALGQLHRSGVTHNRLTPATISIDPRTMTVTMGAPLTGEDEVPAAAGSKPPQRDPAYLSPEAFGTINRFPDRRSDLYSLGVIFYRMLTGVLPFCADTAGRYLHCHLARPPRPPRELAPEIPPPLSDIVLRLLAKEPDERYQSASGLQADLERCLNAWRECGAIPSFPLGADDLVDRILLPHRLYGRSEELAALEKAYDTVATTGRPDLLLLSGEAGTGKTALAQALHKSVLAKGGAFACGRGQRELRAVPFAVLGEALQDLVKQVLTARDEELAQWRKQLGGALGSKGQLLCGIAPELTLLLAPSPPLPELVGAQGRHRFAETVSDFLALCAGERPLVLFLDDLHLADTGTLDMIEHLLTAVTVRGAIPLLILGSYRRSEVTGNHPLLSMQERLARQKPVAAKPLLPLTAAEVTAYVTDALHAEVGDLPAFASILTEITGGNPFFLRQLLLALQDEGLLAFDPRRRRWHVEVEDIRKRGYTDNVAQLMVTKLCRLDPTTLRTLTCAAVMGYCFDLPTLAAVCASSEDEMRRVMDRAHAKGFLLRQDGTYLFLHDRVHEAAYGLQPVHERPALHLEIGRRLLAAFSPKLPDRRLFQLLHHLNLGAPLMENADERLRLASLNLQAARRAQASTATREALDYLAKGARLLGPRRWEDQYRLTYDLYLEVAHTLYLSGAFPKGAALGRHLIARARDRMDQARAYLVLIDTCTCDEREGCAREEAVRGLSLFGIDISLHPDCGEVQRAFQEVWEILGTREIEQLLELPPLADPAMETALELLAHLYPTAFHRGGNLCFLAVCLAVQLSIRRGIAPASVPAFGWFGVLLSTLHHRHDEGYRFARMAHDLMERHGTLTYKAKALFLLGIVSYRSQTIDRTLQYSRASFQAAVSLGDLPVACFSCIHTTIGLLVRGDHLGSVHRDVQEGLAFTARSGCHAGHEVLVSFERLVAALRDPARDPSGRESEAILEPKLEKRRAPHRMSTLRFYRLVVRMMARYWAGSFREALATGEEAGRLRWAGLSGAHCECWNFFYALTVAALFPAVAPERQVEALRLLDRHHERLLGPEKRALLAAEIARCQGRLEQAISLYQEAIDGARRNGLSQLEALAQELAARFYRGHGLGFIADTYLKEARAGYQRWGAEGKVARLDAEFPFLAPGGGAPLPESESAVGAALSGAEILSDLDEMLMRVVLQQAGARKGTLILSAAEEQLVVAEGSVEDGTIHVTLTARPAAPLMLPLSLVHYVKRTGERVILEDASEENLFSRDEYLLHERPVSVLCLPLVRHGILHGVLYLENDLVKGAFSSERVPMLEHLATQALLSIENARTAERLGAIVESAPDALLVVDQAGKIRLINAQLTRLFGYEKEELYGRTVEALIPTRFREGHARHHAEFLEHPRFRPMGFGLELNGRRKDGSEFPLAISLSPLPTNQGLLAAASIRDVSEMQKAEAILKQAEAKYRSIFENAAEGIFQASPGGRFLAANPAFARMFGFASAEELMAQVTDIGSLMYLKPETLEEARRQLQENGTLQNFQAEVYRKDGSTIWISVKAHTVRDEGGRILYYEGLAEDITERRLTEQALLLSEARYRTLYQDNPTMIFTVDQNFTVLTVNSFGASQLGYAVEELPGRSVLEVFHEGDRAAVADQLRKCLANPSQVYRWQFRKIHKTGALLWVQEVGQAMFDLKGELNILVVCEDVTERMRAEQALRESESKYRQLSETLEERIKEAVDELRQKDKILIIQSRQAVMGEMISNIAHQWRQPLNTLALLAQELQYSYEHALSTPEMVSTNVKKTMKIIEHMSKTIDDFRNFFRPEKEKVPFRVVERVESALSLLEGSFRATQIKTMVSASADPVIVGYPNEFSQVLVNILINARDAFQAAHTPDPAVTIEIREEDGTTVLTVTDNAGGIPETIMEKIFEPYFTTKGPDKGTGVGLFMSKTIIEKNMNGRLSAKNVEGGAQFRIEVQGRIL